MTAQRTEARRAETHSGSVHEGLVAKPCALTKLDEIARTLPPILGHHPHDAILNETRP